MKFGEIVFYLLITLTVMYGCYKFYRSMTKAEREYNNDLRERLKDELIYDPETGTRITLEEAESGHWSPHSNPNRIKTQEEIDTYYFGNEKEEEELVNHVKAIGYESTKLSESQIEFLEQSKILSKYDSWSYSNSFTFNNGENFFFLPNVVYNGRRNQSGYNESQIMLWIKNDNLTGHVYIREKTNFEAITDLVRNDDEIKLHNYETFVFKKSLNTFHLIKTLRLFETEKDLEIEIIDGNLFIKTLKYANLNDFLKIEKIVKNVC